jgi:HSP20 family protein
MNSLTKPNGNTMVVPTFRNFLDNFWNADPFFTEDFFASRNKWLPAVNIKENDNNFEIEVAAPGFNKKDFDVKIENGMLCISAEKEETKEEKEKNYTRKEFSYNSFSRSFSLPENADGKTVDAKYTDGVLTLALKKTAAKKPEVKKIAVK